MIKIITTFLDLFFSVIILFLCFSFVIILIPILVVLMIINKIFNLGLFE